MAIIVRYFVFSLFCSITLILLGLASTAYGQNPIKITGISGASNHTIPETGTPIIYGGITGAYVGGCATISDTSSTCSNCVGSDVACNATRIHPGLELKISFTVEADLTGEAFIGYGTDTEIDAAYIVGSRPTGLEKGSTATITVLWAGLCGYSALADTGCFNAVGTDVSLTIFIGVGASSSTAFASTNKTNITIRILDPNGDGGLNDEISSTSVIGGGFFGFKAHPGDKKAYIRDVSVLNNCTNLPKARVHYSTDLTDGVTNATYGPDYVDLNVATDCSPTGDWVVPDLSNDTAYAFRISMLDAANNNVYLLDDAEIELVAACAAGTDAGCDYIATPSEVAGLLAEALNCYIATAAYGTPLHQHLNTLREFRDRILLPHSWGKKLVLWYYEVSPRWAKMIAETPWLKTASRVVLWPFWGFAWLSLHYGVGGALLALASLLALAVIGLRSQARGRA
jgi:hypothetical protein